MTSSRREFPKRIRAEIVNRAMNDKGQVVCEGCDQVLAGKRYEIDHVIPEGLVVDKSAELTADDGQLLGVDCCHRGGRNKTASDVRKIAKARRAGDKHTGAHRPRKPWPGGRKSKWKIKLNGEVVLR